MLLLGYTCSIHGDTCRIHGKSKLDQFARNVRPLNCDEVVAPKYPPFHPSQLLQKEIKSEKHDHFSANHYWKSSSLSAQSGLTP